MFYEGSPSINRFTKIYAAQPFYITFRFSDTWMKHYFCVWHGAHLAPVVQKVDSAIHWINFLLLDNAIDFPNAHLLDIAYPLDSAIQRLNNRGSLTFVKTSLHVVLKYIKKTFTWYKRVLISIGWFAKLVSTPDNRKLRASWFTFQQHYSLSHFQKGCCPSL